MEITTTAQLKTAIAQVQIKNEEQKIILRQQFNEVIESLKPVNLLKSTVKDIAESPGIAKAAIGTTVAIGAGVLTKKMIVGNSTSIFKRILGGVMEFVVANGIANNSNAIADRSIKLLKKLTK